MLDVRCVTGGLNQHLTIFLSANRYNFIVYFLLSKIETDKYQHRQIRSKRSHRSDLGKFNELTSGAPRNRWNWTVSGPRCLSLANDFHTKFNKNTFRINASAPPVGSSIAVVTNNTPCFDCEPPTNGFLIQHNDVFEYF